MPGWRRMKVTPNPAVDHVEIRTYNKTPLTVDLVSRGGKVVQQMIGAGTLTMKLEGLKTGHYAIRVTEVETQMYTTFSLRIQKRAPEPG